MWTAFDAVVIRSCWDYHLHGAAFHAWLDRLEQSGVVVWNSPATRALERRQALPARPRRSAVLRRFRRGSCRADVSAKSSASSREKSGARFVIKPAVSASGFETYALEFPIDASARETIARVVTVGDVLVQPFAEEIPRDGEISFMFIDGEYSHATLKRAATATGEFRVQTEHGGSVDPHAAPADLIEQAAKSLASLPDVPLYARVDGIARDGAVRADGARADRTEFVFRFRAWVGRANG